MIRFYTPERLGKSRRLTPEGFLVIEGVAVARTGDMTYGPEEVPVEPNKDGIIIVSREPEEVFDPKTLASGNGKPFTLDHPDEDVTPENWEQYAKGTLINPRRGVGIEDDCLLMDLVVSSKAAIDAINSGTRDLSCGYDADYIDLGNGRGAQKNIRINHVALVDIGRCGPRCSIGDRSKETSMAKTTWLDRLRRAFKDGDEDEVKNLMEKAPAEVKDAGVEGNEGADTHVHMHLPSDDHRTVDADDFEAHRAQNEADHQEFRDRLDALEAKTADTGGEDVDEELEEELEEEAPDDVKDKARKARDSAYLDDSFQATVAMAEILAPGIRIPTFDRAAKPKTTFDAIAKLRKQALDVFNATEEGRGMIEDIHGRALDTSKLTHDAARTLFRAAASAKRVANNATKTVVRDTDASPKTITTNAEFNARARERWGQTAH